MKTMPELADIICYKKQQNFLVVAVKGNHWGDQWKTIKLLSFQNGAITDQLWHEGVFDPLWEKVG
jgi:hypothetical protein